MIRYKVERMFNSGKSTKEIAEFFSLPIDIIEEMICAPPRKQVKGFPGKDETGKVRGAFKANSGYFV